MARDYSLQTIKLLFGRSNRCAYPECSEQLVFSDRDLLTVAVQIAHIRSETPRGPRHDPDYEEDVDGEANLLLLCGKHHKHVDDHASAYSTEELLTWKQQQVAQGTGIDLSDNELRQILQRLAATMPFSPRMRSRAETLDNAHRELHGRRAARLKLFVPPHRRDEVLAWMTALDDPVVTVPTGNVRVLVASLGAGKSEQANRWWEQGLREAESADDVDVPLFFTARMVAHGLQDAIVAKLGADPHLNCRVVVDELDGVPTSEAQNLLHEARTLVHAWPQVSVLACTRPGLALAEEERIDVPAWSPDRGAALVSLVLGEPAPHHLWTAETSTLLTNPLTSLALAAQVRAGRNIRISRTRLLADLATQAACVPGQDVPDETWEDLASLAVVLLEPPHVAKSTLFRLPRVQRLIATGLVVENSGELTFALPVFEQYFGAEAIASDSVDLATAAAPRSFPRWRYALAVAVSSAPTPARQEELLLRLAKINPAALFWIMGEVSTCDLGPLTFHTDTEISAVIQRRDVNGVNTEPNLALRAGRWLREAETALLEGLGPLAKSLVRHHDGRPARWGIWLQNGWATLARARDAEGGPEVTPLTEPWPPRPHNWQSVTGFTFPAHDFGRWHIAQQTLQKQLATAIQRRTLSVPKDSWLARERTYDLAKFVHTFDNGRGHSTPIDVAEIRERVSAWEERAAGTVRSTWSGTGRNVDVDSDDIRWLSSQLALETNDLLLPPWPEGDLVRPRATWTWELYSPKLTLALAEIMVREALVGYRQLVEQNFPAFGDALGLYGMFPVRAEVLVMRFTDTEVDSPDVRLAVLPDNSTSDFESAAVVSTLVTGLQDPAYGDWCRRIRHVPRNAFNPIDLGNIDHPIWDSNAATTLAYRWLRRDLAALGWHTER
ncbi:hypothetical protein [Lentzea sp. NEAU-D7]|uniref:hypothetical protein n=1 Tax=Lentzea sp. NEAU-D7 TaxID=2994667 RepID=UPI00224AD07F|nr:hypothetical protein [Lentzea sp. NEAU-D7]MCX2948801.1 hypothetical protein [Lentzea sp. NEAU-D7]MCX2951359.1 hypothetical protein [Lentzea sp. NEAU-D7]